MMKNEFLARLKDLLSDLPEEEREEAVRYYEDYFADAGPLEEARVLRELVSPEDVAEKIRAGCGGGKPDEGDVFQSPAEESQGAQVGAKISESTRAQRDTGEDGKIWEQHDAGKNPMNGPWNDNAGGNRANEPWNDNAGGNQANGPWNDNAGRNQANGPWDDNAGRESRWTQEDAYAQEQRMRMGEAYAQDYGEEGEYASRGRHSRTERYFSPVVFLLALLIGLPVLCPLFLMLICMMGGFFVCFGIGGIGLVAGGVTLIGSAFANLSSGIGMTCLFSGGGLILAAIGILFIVLAVNCAFRAIPALLRGIRHIVLSLRGRRAF